ncbi:MAG: FAD-dependent oxidoreductase [Pseudomonadota bacterium]
MRQYVILLFQVPIEGRRMAGTPLFKTVQRALRLARAGHRGGLDADAVVTRWQETAALRSRREFLLTSTLALAGAATACVPLAPQRPGAADVVVIGAGIAGLTAAHRLVQAGVKVRLFEAQNRIGGRILSLRNHFADGQVAELGGELIDSGHRHLRSLAAELGLALDDFEQDQPELARAVWFFEGHRRSEQEVIEAFLPIAAAIERDLATLGEGDITYHTPQNAAALDRESLSDWFDRHSISGWIRSLLAVAYTTEMGLEPEQQSALNLLTFISAEPDPFRVFGESDERFHVRGGNDLVIQELGRRLGSVIETGAVLESLRQSAAGAYRLSLRRDGASSEVTASHVILTLPVTTLRQVDLTLDLPVIKRRAIAELAYGTNAKLMIGFARRIWRESTASDGSSFSDLPYQTSWETSRMQAGAAGILTNFVGGQHGIDIGQGSAADQAERAVADLERLYPGIAAQRIGMREARFHWPSHPWTQGSYLCLRPGDWTGLGGAIAEPVGRLRFAGEHCSTLAQGFMEGGCETGENAAAELLAELGLVAPGSTLRRVLMGRAA